MLVRNGRISAVGSNLAAGNAQVVDANGRPLTPALFGGINGIGIEEVSGEQPTVDSTQSLGAGAQPEMTVRPEFDVTLAYNPESVLIPVARVEGIGFTLLSAGSTAGGSIIGGQGGVVRLDGSIDPIGPRVLFVHLGAGASMLTGNSRAAQWMILDQLVDEARGRIGADSKHSLLTPAGRAALAKYLDGRGRVVVEVNRAADIHQLLRWSKRHGVRIAIAGGGEAWKVASQLATAQVPVFVDTLANLPGDFDRIGATLENAARLQAAGVAVGFAPFGDGSHNARKIRQLAGNAVANGLPWADALAALTRVPAEAFGVGWRTRQHRPGQARRPGAVERRSAGSQHGRRAGLAGWPRATDALAPDRTARSLPAWRQRTAARLSRRRTLTAGGGASSAAAVRPAIPADGVGVTCA